MAENDDMILILSSKISILESILYDMLGEKFLGTTNPEAAIEGYATRFKNRMERGMGSNPDDPAWISVSQNIDIFFDQLRHLIRKRLSNNES